MSMKMTRKIVALCIILSVFLFTGCASHSQTSSRDNIPKDIASIQGATPTLDSIPPFSGTPYAVINNNVPSFSEDQLNTKSFEYYSELDGLGRCQVAYACLGKDLMPTKERGNISSVKPTGWHLNAAAEYNRAHLIGFQLAGEDANKKNLITGTRYMNVDGMLPFENMVTDYIKETGNHVLYRVTPLFQGENLVANGVQMEGKSVEDKGEGILFNVYIYNVAPGKSINYATGESNVGDQAPEATKTNGKIRGNSKSKVYHCPEQNSYKDMEKSKYLVTFDSEKEAEEAGYRKAKN